MSGDSQEQQGTSGAGESRDTNCSLKPLFSATGIYPVPFSLNASEKESLKPAHRLQHAAGGARAFTPAPALVSGFSMPSCQKRTPNLHEDGFDGVLDVAVRRPAQQLPQAPLRQLRGALLLLLRGLQRRGGAAVKAEEGDESGAERAAAVGGEEARSPDGEGMEQNSCGIRLEPLLPRGCPSRSSSHASPCQEGIGAQPRHKLVLGLSQIGGRCRYRDPRAPWMFGMAPFSAPHRVRLQEQPPRPQDWKETQLSGCYRSPRGDAASQRRKNKAGSVAQHKSR